MPKGKPHKSAPFFTAAELGLANDCARLIWHGISFESAKPCVSDEQLMSYFATLIASAHPLKSNHNHIRLKSPSPSNYCWWIEAYVAQTA